MKPSDLRIAAMASVTVTAPARLHLGFIDPSGWRGRRFGSLGLAIEEPVTRLTLRFAERDAVEAAGDGMAETCARLHDWTALLRRHFGRPQSLYVRIEAALPAHAGFGSGTQLALAIGHAFAILHGIDVRSLELARLLGRGARSGIGIASFDHGGLLLDGGPAGDGAAPLLARVELPPHWRVVLCIDPLRSGLAGACEAAALAQLPPLPRAAAADLAHLALMQILPAAHEGDFPAFAQGVSEMQRVLGAHFAPAQQGRPYTSEAVQRALDWLGAHYAAAVGQSSWGPTGFAIFDGAAAAADALAQARAAGAVASHLQLLEVAVRNRPATVEICA
ncbi:MAG: beta-ribofuranosylaminobenzene 5'-phosphate synthase [Burkholderiaceae bacterium]|nr:beta-ribofuranosylaminobenzene 5'-phosphate synthase [Burkholderiaceae bacterium]